MVVQNKTKLKLNKSFYMLQTILKITHTLKTQNQTFKKQWFTFWASFCEELSVVKTNKAFRGYAMTYKVELIDKKINYHN